MTNNDEGFRVYSAGGETEEERERREESNAKLFKEQQQKIADQKVDAMRKLAGLDPIYRPKR